MRLPLLTLLCLALYASPTAAQRYLDMIEAGTYPVSEIQKEAEKYFDVVGHQRGSGYKPYKRWEYVALLELDDKGIKIPNVELSQAARDYRQAENQRQKNGSGNSAGGDWKQLGPTSWNATSSWSPGLGRVTSVGIEENNPNHIIAGSPSGGVWKTLDGGTTWMPISDNFSTVDVYAVEISPYNNQLYLWGSTSGKIFRSTDGGASWTTTSNVTGGGRVSRIQFHPTDPNIVYVVSESNGLFRSNDSGNSWSPVSGASNVPGYDVEFKPGDPNTIYFSGTSVYRSTNGGMSFSPIGGTGTLGSNYKRMAVSAATPNILYVVEANGGRFGAFYQSNDSGASFNKLVDGSTINYFGYSDVGDDDSGQAPRNMDVAASPINAYEVHIGGVHTWKSVDGGEYFELTSYWTPGHAAELGVGYNHADIGILKFVGNTLYVTSDGGFFTSIDGAATFQSRSAGLAIREFYKIGVSKTNPNVVSGGSQDNGTSVMRTSDRLWVDWIGADGMESFVDWNNSNILYGTSQNGSMYRSLNQGNSQIGIDKPQGVDDGAWVTPFEQDPQVASTIYVAFADVWKSSNSGFSWTKISDFGNGNMSQMKLAPSDNKRIYVSRGSSLFTTANGGTDWTTTAWSAGTISYITVHPQNPQRLVVVTTAGVYQSTNAGGTWTDMSTGLPLGAKYCAVWENSNKNGVYVGGFGFVAYTNDDLNGQWNGYFDGLPNVRVYELEINYVSNTIFAGTYGRGLWESPLFQQLPPVTAFSSNKWQGCRELTVTFKDESENFPNAWEWSFEGGNPATSNLQNPSVTFNGVGTRMVQLKTTNGAGENTLVKDAFITLYDPAAPQTTDAERCGPGALLFEATGQAGEQISWYADAQAATALASGNVFAPNLSQNDTFYVSAGIPYLTTLHVGPSSNQIGSGGVNIGSAFLVVDAAKPLKLKSALVYAAGAANRTFQLRNANGMVLLSKTIFVEDGESRVPLDMDIPQGANLQIGCLVPASLYRNTTGANYPYSVNGLLQITKSTGNPAYYFYLYDLEVESLGLCESERTSVTGTIHDSDYVPSVAVNNLCHLEAPTGSAYQWFLDGVAIVGANTQFWSALDTGQYSLYMENLDGCSGISEPVFAVACASGTTSVDGILSARIYPSPASDQVFLDIKLQEATSASLDLFAADGRFVARLFKGDIFPGRQVLNIPLPVLPTGVYQFRLSTERGAVNGSLIVRGR